MHAFLVGVEAQKESRLHTLARQVLCQQKRGKQSHLLDEAYIQGALHILGKKAPFPVWTMSTAEKAGGRLIFDRIQYMSLKQYCILLCICNLLGVGA